MGSSEYQVQLAIMHIHAESFLNTCKLCNATKRTAPQQFFYYYDCQFDDKFGCQCHTGQKILPRNFWMNTKHCPFLQSDLNNIWHQVPLWKSSIPQNCFYQTCNFVSIMRCLEIREALISSEIWKILQHCEVDYVK